MPWWVKFLESLLLLLPRRWIPITLQPEVDLKPIDPTRGEWAVVGADPRFSLKWGSDDIRPGWYTWRPPSHAIRVTVLPGSMSILEMGPTRQALFPFRQIAEAASERFSFYQGRKDPVLVALSVGGRFSQSDLIIHRITWLESFYRRLARVLFDRYRKNQRHLLHDPVQIAWLDILVQLAALLSQERRASSRTRCGYRLPGLHSHQRHRERRRQAGH